MAMTLKRQNVRIPRPLDRLRWRQGGLAREARPVALAGAVTGVRDGGNRQRAGAGLTAWRQRPAPVRCRARGSGPGCRPAAASAPSPSALGGGPPARPLAPCPVILASALRARPGRPLLRERSSGLDKGWRPVSCPAIGRPFGCPH